ncbi:MAG TPA: PQQ-binding-like beta-propeller repeat protein [Pirellulaceae bacterium]|jgi:outer membrane protein assembly factor BamB|nr:PQQ-binding-like beta-propeller repeat protein [Pirellulaceae bacterium]
MALATAACFCFAALPTFAAEPANWPQFRGPSQDNRADEAKLPLNWSEEQNVAWKTEIPGKGWSSPVVWDDQVWVGSADEDGKKFYAVCVDVETGELLKTIDLFEVGEPAFCHPMNSYASPTPVVEEGRVYVHFGSYGTAAINTQTFDVLWKRNDLPCDHYRGPGSSPVVFENLLICTYDGFDLQYVVAFDKKTGETVWKKDREIDYGNENGDFKKAFSTPIFVTRNRRVEMVSPTSRATIAYDPRTGEERWRVTYSGFSATAQALLDEDGTIYINTGFGKAELHKVDASEIADGMAKVLWEQKKNVGSKPSQVLVGNRIYNVSDGGVVSCLDAESGEEVWSDRLEGQFSASVLYADGRLYLFNHEGQAFVVAAKDEYELLARNELENGCLASPAVHGDALIVRTTKHLYRIEE